MIETISGQEKAPALYEEKRYRLLQSRLYHDWLFEQVLSRLPRDVMMLDNGCGVGLLFEKMTHGRVVGLDLSEAMLKRAKQRAPWIVRADCCHLPFLSEAFGAIVAKSLLHHLPEPRMALQEMHRVLKKGGEVVFLDTHYSPLSSIPRRLLQGRKSFSSDHKNFTKEELMRLINPFFEIEEVAPVGYVAYPLLGFPDLMNFLWPLPFKGAIARGLIKLDEALAQWPLFNGLAWGILIKAKKERPCLSRS